MKKSITQLLVFLLLIQLFTVSTWTQRAYAAPSGGSGTLLDPYIILNEDDLSDIRDDLSAHYKLGANINLSDYDYDGSGPDTGGWLPIGSVNDTTSNSFTGSLDGNGYTISNMKINRPTIMNAGLFGKIDSTALLSNIRLRDIQIVGSNYAGGLVGRQIGGKIESSYVTGSIHVTGQAPPPSNVSVNAGGVAGLLDSAIIENSYAVVDVSGWTRIGGLVGTNAGTIKNSYAAGRVNANSEVGGLVGYNTNSSGIITNSYAAGSVNGSSLVGGLVGRNDSGGTATSSYWNIDTTSRADSAVGSGLTSEGMKQTAAFGWDSSVWGIIEGVTYPYLRAFGMGIGVDPLAVTTYSLQPGQDAVSVTGSVYHESATEPINVQYIIRDSAGDTVTQANYATNDSDALRSINHRFSLSDYDNGDYTIAVIATDSHLTSVGTMLAFTVNDSGAAPPAVHFTNNDGSWTRSASTTVTITDSGGGIDTASLQYIWSTDSATPGPGSTWTSFASGDTLTRSGVSGDIYLHIRAKDNSEVTANVVSNRFRLDNIVPSINISMVNDDSSAYVNDTWTNQHVTLNQSTTDANGVVTNDYSVDGGTSWIPYTVPLILEDDGIHSISFKAVDEAGNETIAQRIVKIDSTAPAISFATNGSETLAKSASTTVTVTDAASGANTSSLRYAWTTNAATPASGWNTFVSGAPLSIDTVDGERYLHIEASDTLGNTANVVSNRFRLDNTAPSINITMTKDDSSAYTNDTWTNQSVTLIQSATDANGVVTNEYSVDGGTSWNPYTAQIVIEDDGIHLLSFRAVDAAGNETTVHRTVKISSSGLLLTPTLTTLGGDPYVSGSWTNESVTVSVYAQAGDSGITNLTYTMDSGSPHAYVNEDPITLSLEGQHTLRFDVEDGAGNTFNATLAVNIDLTRPSVTFESNGSEMLSLTASTTVTVTDGASGVDAASLQYAWTSDTTTPSSGWSSFTNGEALSKNGVNGDAYLHIRATDLAGNTINVVSNRFRLYVASSSTPTATKPSIDVNGVALDPDSIDLTKPSLLLDVTPKDGKAFVSIPASLLLDFAGKKESFFFEIKAPYGSYQLPVNLGSFIPGLQGLLASSNLKAEDISFKITLTDKSSDKDIQQAFTDKLPSGSVMGAIVDFHLEVVNIKTGRSIGTVDQFNKALTRVIPMPKNRSSMPDQWGAFRYNEATEAFEFVPARAVQIDGVWYVMIHSYTNSVYAVARHPVSFKDTLTHWGKPYVDLAAAKGLMEGVGGDRFAPDRSITRAEFTAMLIRALGYSGSTGASSLYDDVRTGSWYNDIVATARELGLLDFIGGTNFKPDQALTREEMASMLAAVIAREHASLAKQQANLDHYKDAGDIDAAYLEDVRIVVQLNLMTGTSAHTFSPEGQSTRAQAAAVLVRTLRALEMID